MNLLQGGSSHFTKLGVQLCLICLYFMFEWVSSSDWATLTVVQHPLRRISHCASWDGYASFSLDKHYKGWRETFETSLDAIIVL